MKISQKTKEKIIAEASRLMHAWYAEQPEDKGNISGMCLFWSFFTVKACKKYGIPAQIQAGSAYWPRLTKEQDTGQKDNW